MLGTITRLLIPASVHLHMDKPAGGLLLTNPRVIQEHPYSDQWEPEQDNQNRIQSRSYLGQRTTGGLKQFKFYFIFTAWDHMEHQPIYHNRWLKQELKSFTWGSENKLIFDFSYINYWISITKTVWMFLKYFKLLLFAWTVF